MNKDRKGYKTTYKQPEMVPVPQTGGYPETGVKTTGVLKLVVMVQLQKVLKPAAQWHKDKQ
jgi:hypothetical protein